MAISKNNLSKALEVKERKVRESKGSVKAEYKPIDNTNRFVISAQTMRSSDNIKLNGRIYDPTVAEFAKSKGKLKDNFAFLHGENGKLFLVVVDADKMAHIQGLNGKNAVCGQEFAETVIIKGERAGETVVVDRRRQLNTAKFGMPVSDSRNCQKFEVPTTGKLIANTVATIGKDNVERILDGKNLRYVIGTKVELVIPVDTNKLIDPTLEGKTNARYAKEDVTFVAFELMPKFKTEVKGEEVVSTTEIESEEVEIENEEEVEI